jgi:hypothetical protein
MSHSIDWGTAKVHLNDHARFVLTVQVVADPAQILLGESAPNPVWRNKFSRLATERQKEWQKQRLHWDLPVVDTAGVITIDIDSSLSEAEILGGELNDLVAKANEHTDDEWERLKKEADELTHTFRSF